MSGSVIPPGPLAYKNWHAHLKSEPPLFGYELNFYSDASILGNKPAEISYGPYTFINIDPQYRESKVDEFIPRIVVRAWDHMPLDTGFSSYNLDRDGGSLREELAALMSLDLGIKIRAGGRIRLIERDGSNGHPVQEDHNRIPYPPYKRPTYPILPDLDKANFDIKRLEHYPKLESHQATTLVRSALLYQNAIWIAELDPNFAWLTLISAIETAANLWYKSQPKFTALESFREIKPQWSSDILKKWGEEAEIYMADKLQEIIGSTYKFVKFIEKFGPTTPPSKRSKDSELQFNFEKDLLKAIKIIYNYRSRALHSGIQFPYPMCGIPFILDETHLEVPVALGVSGGTAWTPEEVPMLLRTFEYITRKSLQSWWESMIIK